MPTLSVAIIAKNEEQNLPRALSSVADIADEIIVTDTGSTDGTIDIARQFGARVLEFTWIDDFAAAHNFSKSHVSCEWFLMLDADEELLPESVAELKHCISQERVLAFSVLRQDLADESRPDRYTEMWQTRLIRNRPELHLQGRCHHHFWPPLAETASRVNLEFRKSTIRLRHYGFVAAQQPKKLRRAMRLLELELRDRPGQFYYVVELGLTLLAVGDAKGQEHLAEAAQMVVDGQRQALDGGGQLAMLLEYVLAAPKLPENFPLTLEKARELAITRFPTAPPLLWQIAREHNAHGRYAQCAAILENLLKLGETHSYDRHVSFSPAIIADDARLNLGVCCLRMGQLSKAKECFRKLLDSPTRRNEAEQNLKAIRQLEKR